MIGNKASQLASLAKNPTESLRILQDPKRPTKGIFQGCLKTFQRSCIEILANERSCQDLCKYPLRSSKILARSRSKIFKDH